MRLVFLLLSIILTFTLINCKEKQPKSVIEKKELEKEVNQKPIEIKLTDTESLAQEVKKRELFPEYNISNYEFLNQDELYKKINGAADGYVKNHGFKGCGYLELSHKIDKTPVIIYVYDMDKGIQGFGIYSSERQSSYNFVNIGNEGYYYPQGLRFWKNKYYINIELQGDSEKGKALLEELGNRLAKMIPNDNTILRPFAYFPKEGRVEKADQYYKNNYASIGKFSHVYEAKYKIGENTASLIFSQFDNVDDINKALESFKELNDIKAFEKKGNSYFAVDPLEKKRYYFEIKDKTLFGAFGFSDENLEKEKIESLKHNLG